jgi:hypothetical protein
MLGMFEARFVMSFGSHSVDVMRIDDGRVTEFGAAAAKDCC